MTNPVFFDSIMFTDRDAKGWALEVRIEDGAEYVAFVTHRPDGPVTPFPAIGHKEAKRLYRALGEALSE